MQILSKMLPLKSAKGLGLYNPKVTDLKFGREGRGMLCLLRAYFLTDED